MAKAAEPAVETVTIPDSETGKATDAEVTTVLDAVRNGNSIPAGFVFDPHGKDVVRKLKDA